MLSSVSGPWHVLLSFQVPPVCLPFTVISMCWRLAPLPEMNPLQVPVKGPPRLGLPNAPAAVTAQVAAATSGVSPRNETKVRRLPAGRGTVERVPAGRLDQLPDWAGRLLDEARAGHLAVLDSAGRPRALPVTYAICQGAAWTVIDNKPKPAGRPPARVGWLRARPHAAITVDRYADDWSELRWVQLLGPMDVLDGPPVGPGMEALAARYPQYRSDPPPGPLLRLGVTRAVWWTAAAVPQPDSPSP